MLPPSALFTVDSFPLGKVARFSALEDVKTVDEIASWWNDVMQKYNLTIKIFLWNRDIILNRDQDRSKT